MPAQTSRRLLTATFIAALLSLAQGCASWGEASRSTAADVPGLDPLALELSSCSAPAAELDRAAMTQTLADYQQLSEEALSMRAQAIRLYHELDAKTARREALSGHDLQRLNSGAAALLAQRKTLLQIAFAHECWLDGEEEAAAADARAVRRAGILMSLAAALTLYDNYLSAISLYHDDTALRQHLNRRDSGFDIDHNELDRITSAFSSPAYRQRVRRGLEWYERNAAMADTDDIEGSAYLQRLIAQSPSYQLVRRSSPLQEFGTHVGLLRLAANDALTSLRSEGVNLSSLLFGNTIGLIETRRGKLDKRPEVLAQVSQQLRAGDILLEKTPFRLTDTFIPGHWGHAAIWIGNEAELRELGVWEHPVVQAYQAEIRAGHGVVEALRSGVEMNPIAAFLNIDDLAVLRGEQLSDAERASVVLQTLRQVGKAYDFNFDAETTKRVFCSKLVYLAYGDMQWPTARVFGRVTISPDNIAARAVGDGPLSVALLYHDGQEITEDPRALLAQLTRHGPERVARSETAAR